MNHVYPENEAELHTLEGIECRCGPNMIMQAGEVLMIHRYLRFDHLIAQAEMIAWYASLELMRAKFSDWKLVTHIYNSEGLLFLVESESSGMSVWLSRPDAFFLIRKHPIFADWPHWIERGGIETL